MEAELQDLVRDLHRVRLEFTRILAIVSLE